jgi:osmotically-inducible protein OsmY
MAITAEARSDAELKTDVEAEPKWDPRVHRNEIGVAVIKQKIQQALVRSAETEADRIIVQVDGSNVTLRGAVRSYAEKQEAEQAAWAAPGVTSVDNRISLSPF